MFELAILRARYVSGAFPSTEHLDRNLSLYCTLPHIDPRNFPTLNGKALKHGPFGKPYVSVVKMVLDEQMQFTLNVLEGGFE